MNMEPLFFVVVVATFAFPVREINLDSIQAPEPRTREEFLQCESLRFNTFQRLWNDRLLLMFTPKNLKHIACRSCDGNNRKCTDIVDIL